MTDVGTYFDRGANAFVAVSEPVWDPIGERTVRVAGLGAGERVLDACCGAGASALPAARAVGAHGHVDAVDLAAGLLERGRQRAGREELDNVEFHHGDVTEWHRRAIEYDAMICVLGVFFLPEPATATAKVLRNVRLGGRAVITTWAQDAVQPLGRCLWDACAVVRPEKFGVAPDTTPATRFETPERLTRFGECLGLSRPVVTSTPRQIDLTGQQAWNLVIGTALAGLLADMSEAEIEVVRDRFGAALAAAGDRVDFGTLTLVGQVGAIANENLRAFDGAPTPPDETHS